MANPREWMDYDQVMFIHADIHHLRAKPARQHVLIADDRRSELLRALDAQWRRSAHSDQAWLQLMSLTGFAGRERVA